MKGIEKMFNNIQKDKYMVDWLTSNDLISNFNKVSTVLFICYFKCSSNEITIFNWLIVMTVTIHKG